MDYQSDSTLQDNAPDTTHDHKLTYAQLKQLADIAYEVASRQSIPIAFSFVSPHAELRFFFAMDDVLLVSPGLSQKKAYTAAAMKTATANVNESRNLLGGPLYGLTQNQNLCVMKGGLPCWHQGQLLGAIGISGGTEEEDNQIALQTLKTFSEHYFSLTAEKA